MTLENTQEAQAAEAKLNSYLQLIGKIAKDNGIVGVFAAASRYTVGDDLTPRYIVGSMAAGILHMPMAEFGPLVASLGEQSGEAVSRAAHTAFHNPEAQA